MKLQTRHTAARRPVSSRKKDQKSWVTKLYILMYLLVVVSVVFGVANYRIDLNRKINDLQKAGNRAKQEKYELERDIQALKIDRERLSSWENVRSRIARYNLPFRAAEPRQVRLLTIKSYRNTPLANTAEYEEKSLSVAR